MGFLPILDLVIGLSFIYLLLSLICVSLQEIKARKNDERSKNLKKWVYDTFNILDKEDKAADHGTSKTHHLRLGERLWNNIIIDGLTQDGKDASYISKEVFVSALLDEIYYESDDKMERKMYKNLSPDSDLKKLMEEDSFKAPKEPYTFHSLREAIAGSTLLPNRMKRVMLQIHFESHENLESFRDRLERWYERAMERNAGTFKKSAQKSVFRFAIVVTILLNANSITLVDYFYRHPAEAARIADLAEKQINDPAFQQRLKEIPPDSSTKALIRNVQGSITEIQNLKLPIGWTEDRLKAEFVTPEGWAFFLNVVMLLLGWAITAISVSLGAPFWYDMLNKLVDLRSAGRKPKAEPATGAATEGGPAGTTPIG